MINEALLIKILDNGINPELANPFAALAVAAGCSETDIIDGVNKLKSEGKIKRFGLVVKNRNVGFVHNAMVVLNVPNESVDKIGELISTYPFVKLCYQRTRILPQWPYNLYFMVHGKNRDLVLSQIDQVLTVNQYNDFPREILFSKQCLKQKGAAYH